MKTFHFLLFSIFLLVFTLNASQLQDGIHGDRTLLDQKINKSTRSMKLVDDIFKTLKTNSDCEFPILTERYNRIENDFSNISTLSETQLKELAVKIEKLKFTAKQYLFTGKKIKSKLKQIDRKIYTIKNHLQSLDGLELEKAEQVILRLNRLLEDAEHKMANCQLKASLKILNNMEKIYRNLKVVKNTKQISGTDDILLNLEKRIERYSQIIMNNDNIATKKVYEKAKKHYLLAKKLSSNNKDALALREARKASKLLGKAVYLGLKDNPAVKSEVLGQIKIVDDKLQSLKVDVAKADNQMALSFAKKANISILKAKSLSKKEKYKASLRYLNIASKYLDKALKLLDDKDNSLLKD